MTMRNITLLSFASLIILTVSCKKSQNDTGILEARTIIDTAYGTHPKQKMDIYLPKGRTEDTPVIILLHGGAFVAGDKNEFSLLAQQFAAKGYAVLNVNYRLVNINGLIQSPPLHQASEVHISDQLEDVKLAVNFAEKNAPLWKVSPDKWAAAGHSAGGTLALLYGYDSAVMNKDKRIKAAANWAGVLDFSYQDESELKMFDPRLEELLYRIAGKEPNNANKAAFKDISIIYNVTAENSIPTLNIRPEFNRIFTMPDISKPSYLAFSDILTSINTPNKLIEVKDADHGFSAPADWNLIINETVSFFNQHLE